MISGTHFVRRMNASSFGGPTSTSASNSSSSNSASFVTRDESEPLLPPGGHCRRHTLSVPVGRQEESAFGRPTNQSLVWATDETAHKHCCSSSKTELMEALLSLSDVFPEQLPLRQQVPGPLRVFSAVVHDRTFAAPEKDPGWATGAKRRPRGSSEPPRCPAVLPVYLHHAGDQARSGAPRKNTAHRSCGRTCVARGFLAPSAFSLRKRASGIPSGRARAETCSHRRRLIRAASSRTPRRRS